MGDSPLFRQAQYLKSCNKRAEGVTARLAGYFKNFRSRWGVINVSEGIQAMEVLKRHVVRIAHTPDSDLSALSPLQRFLLFPLLSFASYFYSFGVHTRAKLYQWGIFKPKRLPVPVISVGNITWGGNGKTPLVEYLALRFSECGLSPLILTRGYAGGDESRMLQSHLRHTTAKLGTGADRLKVANIFLQRYNSLNHRRISELVKASLKNISCSACLKKGEDEIGIVILDDGMQHWRLYRDVEIVMVNCLTFLGSERTIPCGPLREPPSALSRASIIVLHHVNLVSERRLQDLSSILHNIIKKDVHVFHSKLVPCHFFRISRSHVSIPLDIVENKVVLCVSGIGCPESLSSAINQLGASQVARVDFNDHHQFTREDLQFLQAKIEQLQMKLQKKVVVVITEKDFERDKMMFTNLDVTDVFVLHSTFSIEICSRKIEDQFRTLLLNQVLQSLCADI